MRSFLLATTLVGVGLGGCGPTGRLEVIHAQGGDAARAVFRVAVTQQVTVPDNFVMRPDEMGAVAIDHPRALIYVGSREGTLLALDMATAEVLWELPLSGAIGGAPVLVDLPPVVPQPADAVDVPNAAGSEDADRPKDLLLLGTDNGEEIAIDLRTREELWRYSTDGKIRAPAVVAEGVVHIANSREQVFGLDLRTGAWRWQYEQPLQTGFTVSGYAGLTYEPPGPAVDGERSGVLYTGFGNGKVAALDSGFWRGAVAGVRRPGAGRRLRGLRFHPAARPRAGAGVRVRSADRRVRALGRGRRRRVDPSGACRG